jgi:hypothetical protein
VRREDASRDGGAAKVPHPMAGLPGLKWLCDAPRAAGLDPGSQELSAAATARVCRKLVSMSSDSGSRSAFEQILTSPKRKLKSALCV